MITRRSPRATAFRRSPASCSSKAEKSSTSSWAFTPSPKLRSGWMRSWSAKTRPFFVLTLAVLLMTACSSSRHSQVVAAPNFELKDLSGNIVRLESFRGHPVLLDFWATWCGPCRMSIPMVEDFYTRHKGEGLVVLGMNMDDEPSGVYG